MNELLFFFLPQVLLPVFVLFWGAGPTEGLSCPSWRSPRARRPRCRRSRPRTPRVRPRGRRSMTGSGTQRAAVGTSTTPARAAAAAANEQCGPVEPVALY